MFRPKGFPGCFAIRAQASHIRVLGHDYINIKHLLAGLLSFVITFAKLAVIFSPNLRFKLIQTCGLILRKADREADAVISFADGSWALVEVKLSDKEQIKEASKKLVELAADIDEKEHPKPAFLMVITTQNVAIQDENGVYTVPLGCLKP
jgi:hypothetical protein